MPLTKKYLLARFRQGSGLRVMKTWEILILFSRPWKFMEFEKNAKTHEKLMEKIFVIKKNVVMHIFIDSV